MSPRAWQSSLVLTQQLSSYRSGLELDPYTVLFSFLQAKRDTNITRHHERYFHIAKIASHSIAGTVSLQLTPSLKSA
jgi:hypothetical protein